MKKFLTILFFQLTIFAFAAAVFEVDMFGYDHTFFDTCDTYILDSGTHYFDFAGDDKAPTPKIEFPLYSILLNYLSFGKETVQAQSFSFWIRPSSVTQRLFIKHLSLLI